MTDVPIGAVIQYVNDGQCCEAGMFDRSFTCTDTDTERCQLNSTVVWLCPTHKSVILIPPKSSQSTEGR